MNAPETWFRLGEAAFPLQGAVEMVHGSGGRATAELVRGLFHRHFDNAFLAQGNDQAAFDIHAGRMIMTTDAHVISPLFFPGGDIGSLAVHGTINDIAMAGAQPLYLSAASRPSMDSCFCDMIRYCLLHVFGCREVKQDLGRR